MKTKFIIIILTIIPVLLFPQQSLTLVFEARPYEGEDVGLDSILIKNIDRQCASSQLLPVFMSTTSGTSSLMAFFIFVPTMLFNSSSSSKRASKTSSSCT